jgi:cobalt-zinc-cadmium efflux system membrane fusion protein
MKASLFLGFIVFFISCSKKAPENSTDKPTNSNVIEFTDEQLKLSEVKWDNLQKKDIADVIECSGTIELPPQNNLTVSPVKGGNVKGIDILPGMYVKKGQILATLEHPDYLRLQEEYIEVSSRYTFQKEEYKRQGELTLEQATSLKKMQSTEADFKASEAKIMSLKKQLQMLGIDADNLNPEKITSEIVINSPIDGYVTNIYTNRGKYIAAGEKLCEVIDKSHLHLQLNIFERDLPYVKLNQQINFNPAAIPDKKFYARIEFIGQSIDHENNSIPVHAHISPVDSDLKPGMFVNAKIKANPRFVYALPLASLVKKGNDFYGFIVRDNKFYRTKINTGKELDNFVEILPDDSTFLSNKFVTKGAYYLETEWDKNQE